MRSTIPLLLLSVTAAVLLGAFAPPMARNSVKTESSPRTGQEIPVLVELFTSEGCSSCPPADDLLMEIDKAQRVSSAEVIVIGEHVDYWNRLGWADPFSSARFSERQTLYASRFGNSSVYTPQMVVDGRKELVGSDRVHALQAIKDAVRQPKATLTVGIAPRQTGGRDTLSLSVWVDAVPAVSAGDIAEVFLAVTESQLHSQVLRGENSGRRLNHTAVARTLRVVGTLDPGKNAFTAAPEMHLEPDWKRENLKVVVFVQERRSGQVLGVVSIPLTPNP